MLYSTFCTTLLNCLLNCILWKSLMVFILRFCSQLIYIWKDLHVSSKKSKIVIFKISNYHFCVQSLQCFNALCVQDCKYSYSDRRKTHMETLVRFLYSHFTSWSRSTCFLFYHVLGHDFVFTMVVWQTDSKKFLSVSPSQKTSVYWGILKLFFFSKRIHLE